jgi:hypothetical protein
MRQLTEQEKELCRKAIARTYKEIEWLRYMQEITERDLEKGLRLKYERAIEEQKNNLANIKNAIEVENNKIKELENQIKYGVKPKEEAKANG